MTFDYNGYDLKFIQCDKCNDESKHLYTKIYKFFSPITHYSYIIRAEYHELDVYAIKFYCKQFRHSDFKYSKIVNKGDFGGYWWLAKSCPLLSLLIVLNQHFIKSCTMRQNFDGTKMGQNRRKIKPRPLCSEYPYQNTLILNTKVQICPVINEPMSLFLSSITHFSIILYHGRFFKVLDTLFHILQLNNVFLIVVQCSERLPIIETAHLYTPFVRLDSDFSVVMKCVALFPSMANCHLKVSHKDVVNCMLNQ